VPIPLNNNLSPCEKLDLLFTAIPDVDWNNSLRERGDFEYIFSSEEILKGALTNGIEYRVVLIIIEFNEVVKVESEFTCPLIIKLKDKRSNNIYKLLEFN